MGGRVALKRDSVANGIKIKEVGVEYKLKNKGTYLRKYTELDASEIIKWIKDERALKMWSADRYGEFPIKAEDINNNYRNCIENGNFYPMTLMNDDEVIGHFILRNPDSEKEDVIKIGFVIVNDKLRGKGYGKLIMKEAINYARNNLGAKEINLGVFENNDAIHCYKAVGFKEVRIEREVFNFHEEKWNCIEMILED